MQAASAQPLNDISTAILLAFYCVQTSFLVYVVISDAAGTHAASFEARVCQLVQQICSVCPHGKVVENDGIRLEVAIPR